MEKLQQLIKNLNKSEKKMARNFLTNYGNQGKKDTISLELFAHLNTRTKKISNKEASILLFGTHEKNRIRVLKNRLKNKILDALSTEIVIENQEYDKSMKLSIMLKKKLGQFQSLYSSKKADINLLMNILDEIIEKGTEYELYPILIEALNLKKQIIGFREGINVYESYKKKELWVINSHIGLTEIVDDFNKMSLMFRIDTTSKEKLLDYLKKSIEKGERLVAKYKSKNIEHYLNIIKYAYYDEKKQYQKAQVILNSEIQLLTNNKAAYRLSRLGATYDYLSQINIRLGNYKEATKNAEDGGNCFKEGSTNRAVAQEIAFRSLLYDKNIKEAGIIIKKILRNYKDKVDKHRLSTHRYFYACYYFADEQYKKCNQLLVEPLEFKKDKIGWEFNCRILSMMASIEQGKEETAYENYNSLIRYFNRNKSQKKLLNSRNKLILELMGQWLKNGGNKSIAKMKDSDLLAKLSLPKNEWDSLGSELIQFEKWFKSKV